MRVKSGIMNVGRTIAMTGSAMIQNLCRYQVIVSVVPHRKQRKGSGEVHKRKENVHKIGMSMLDTPHSVEVHSLFIVRDR